jgi:drug/metabolite transporter (DMT)-like permease
MLVGIRQTAAGILLLTAAAALGKAQLPSRDYVWKQALTGLCTITGGNGFVTWGMQYVSSGLSAVIGALTPMMIVLINFAVSGPERVGRGVVLGMLVGFGGLGLIFSDSWSQFFNPDYRWGVVACFLSCFTWSLGTVLAKRFNAPGVSPLFNAGLQIAAGGLGGFVCSALFDRTYAIEHSWEAWLSVAYLAVFGSAVAFSLFMYALQHLTAEVSSLYTYVNPVLATLLGWLLLGEHLTWLMVLGMVVTIAGVWLVNRAYFLRRA